MSDNDPERQQAQLEDYASRMNDEDWTAFTARVRPPNSAEQLKEVAAQILSGSQLDAWLSGIDPAKFIDTDGQVDEQRVMGSLTALFGVQHDQPGGQQRSSWGQHGGQPPGALPGAAGRAEAEKRFGKKQTGSSTATTQSGPGAVGRAAAQKRFGTGAQK
ncbi:hypothetical protein [Mycobacterium sp. HUMS_1102779]|uniref:hypothetical protein n=1 Tax=Mycobacterium sp. HUMS_1102779 TaxID=3383487 RepID=UPI003899B957